MEVATGRRGDAASFAFIVVAWGLNYLFVGWGLGLAVPLWLAFFRAVTGAGAVWLVLALRGGPAPLPRRRRVTALLLGIPNTALFFGLWMVAEGSVAPGETAVFVYTYPLWVAAGSVVLLGERLRPVLVGAITLGFAGVALLSEPWRGAGHGPPYLAVAELLAAAICWALGTVLTQRLFRPSEMQSANAHQLVGGSAALALAVALLAPASVPAPSLELLAVVAWLGAVGTATAYALWYRLLGRTRATTLSAFAFLVPVVALVASFFLFSERLEPVQLAGVGLVLLAIVLVGRYRATGRPPHALSDERAAPALGGSE